MSKKEKKNKHGSDLDLVPEAAPQSQPMSKKVYEKELKKLFLQLVEMQYTVRQRGLRVVILFEGRDAAGKGGVIKRLTEPLNPRSCRVVALPAPSDREKSQWYFQRYVHHLPAAGEIVIFDRSWYNRAGVERVMGFCSDGEYEEFSRSCPEFENMLVRSGILLLKYWFSVSDEEQEARFRERAKNPLKRWKLSPMDLSSIERWEDYSRAKDEMFGFSNTPWAPWYNVEANDKLKARLNCIHHILSKIPHDGDLPKEIKIPKRPKPQGYVRPPKEEHIYVPELF
jgi:polyphosphate kinase 2